MVDEILRDVGQPLELFGRLVAAARDETPHVADCGRQVRQRRTQIGLVVHHAGQGGEPVLELDDLLVAVTQCGDEGLQVLDDVDDVAAAVGQDSTQPREFGEGLDATSRRCRPSRWPRCR